MKVERIIITFLVASLIILIHTTFLKNGKAEKHSITQKRRMSEEAWRIANGITYPNYGRKSNTYKKPNY